MEDFYKEFIEEMERSPLPDGRAVLPIDEIDDFSNEDFLKLETVNDIKNLLLQTRFNNDMGDGSEIFLKLNKRLSGLANLKDNQGVKNKYDIILNYLIWFTFPLRSEKEVRKIMEEELLFGIKINVDIYEKIRQRLYLYANDIGNLSERRLMTETLRNNTEELGKNNLVSQEGRNIVRKQTIKNWLSDYDNFTNNDKEKGGVERLNYINNNINTRGLDKDQQNILLEILKIYDFLRYVPVIPSAYQEMYAVRPEGAGVLVKREAEERVNDTQTIKNGFEIEPEKQVMIKSTSRIEPKIETPEEILAAKFQEFMGTDLAQKALDKSEELAKQLGTDLKKIRNSFYTAVNNQDKTVALATMFVLAENKQIRRVFSEDERFINFWSSYLEKAGLEAEAFKNDPAGEKHLARFFKYILEKRLKLDEVKAVMLGMALSNLARGAGEREYQNMVYGDLETGEFEWNV